MKENSSYNSNISITVKGVSIHRESFTADEIIIGGNLETDAEKLYELFGKFITAAEKYSSGRRDSYIPPRSKVLQKADLDWIRIGQHGVDGIAIVPFCDLIYFLKYEDRNTDPDTSYLMVEGFGEPLNNLRHLFDKSADEVITRCDVLHVERVDRRHFLVSFQLEYKGKYIFVDGACLKALMLEAQGGLITRRVLEKVLG